MAPRDALLTSSINAMADRSEPLLAALQAAVHRASGDVRTLAEARWKLARLEVLAAVAEVKRLAIAAAVGGIVALVSIPVLVVAAAELLDGTFGLGRTAWLGQFGVGLLASAVTVAWIGWRRFQARFVGLEETLEELQEDLLWLREWRGNAAEDSPPKDEPPEEPTNEPTDDPIEHDAMDDPIQYPIDNDSPRGDDDTPTGPA